MDSTNQWMSIRKNQLHYPVGIELSPMVTLSTLEQLGPGLKPDMDFCGQVWKRVRKMAFFGLKQDQKDRKENRAAQPHQEFPGVPPRDLKGKLLLNNFYCHILHLNNIVIPT